MKANRIQEKVKGVGFDWEVKEEIWKKLDEEITELKDELLQHKENPDNNSQHLQKVEAELGDLFFTLINAARLYGIDPENALEKTNIKFMERFNYLENKVLSSGKTLKEVTLDEMDELWEEAKNNLNN